MALSGVAWMVEGMVEMEDAAEDPPPLPRRCREERDKTRGDTRGEETKAIATAEHAMAFTYSDKGGNGAESRCVDWCQ